MTSYEDSVEYINSLKVKIDKAYQKKFDLEVKIRNDKKRRTTIIHPGYVVGGDVALADIMNTMSVEPYDHYDHTSFHVPTRSSTELKRILINPNDPDNFIISDKHGNISLYQIDKNMSLLENKWKVNACNSVKAKPTAFAWSPDGNFFVTTYPTKDNQEQQVACMIFDQGRVVDTSCYYNAHKRGEIKGITFIQGSFEHFVTGGKDRRAMYWRKNGEHWDRSIMHDKVHSQEIMGMCDCKDKGVVYSVGRDSKLVAFDYTGNKLLQSHVTDFPAFNIHVNPRDPNLLMLYTKDNGRQIQLYDTRKKTFEVLTRGWTQTQSKKPTLVNQDWSPSGVLIASGSVDPVINVYDIRYDPGVGVPVCSLNGVKGSIYDVEFHPYRPLLLSVSGDPLVGLHELL